MHQNRQADQKDSQCRSQLQRRIAVGVAGRQVFEKACHLNFLLFGLREMIGASETNSKNRLSPTIYGGNLYG